MITLKVRDQAVSVSDPDAAAVARGCPRSRCHHKCFSLGELPVLRVPPTPDAGLFSAWDPFLLILFRGAWWRLLTTEFLCPPAAAKSPTTASLSSPTIPSFPSSKATAPAVTSGKRRCECSMRQLTSPTAASAACPGMKFSPARRPWTASRPGCRTTRSLRSATCASASKAR